MYKRIKKFLLDACRLLSIEAPSIVFKDIGIGMCFENRIEIPLGSYEESLFLGFHELRHYYQIIYVRNIEDSITERIRYEMENYKTLEYKKLYMEQDAYYFANYMMEYYHIPYPMGMDTKRMILDFEKKYSFVFSVFL